MSPGWMYVFLPSPLHKVTGHIFKNTLFVLVINLYRKKDTLCEKIQYDKIGRHAQLRAS